MLIIKLSGDKQDKKFTWSITAEDSHGLFVFTEGVDDSERDAKACMIAAIGTLVETLEFVPVHEDAGTS
jgi:hypothetical protein